MRKLFSLFVALLATTGLWAYGFQLDKMFYNITNDTVEPYTVEMAASMTEIAVANIPNTVLYNDTTYCVTSLGEDAFFWSQNLTIVSIPKSVTHIHENAFYMCPSITDITVEEGNPIYDSRDNCNAIIESATNTLIVGCKNTTFPSTVTSIGGGAFWRNRAASSITIPNTITTIGGSAFAFSSITSINLPNSITTIEVATFEFCTLLTSITIPKSVTHIKDWAFSYCQSLDTIRIEATTPPVLETSVFEETSISICYIPCGTLEAYEQSNWATCVNKFVERRCVVHPTWEIVYTTSDEQIFTPDSTNNFGANIVSNTYEDGVGILQFDGPVTNIGENTFDGWSNKRCHKLTSIIIPSSVVSIEDFAFYYCDSLASILISEGVKTIGDRAFFGCRSLTSIHIPSSVVSIKRNPVIGNSNLLSITVDSNNTIYDCRDNCNAIIETATNTLIAGCKTTFIPKSITSIADGAFDGCSLTSLTIPENVVSVGLYALRNTCLDTLYIKAITPPDFNGFYDTDADCPNPICYVPCGTRVAYLSSEWIHKVNEFREKSMYALTLYSINEALGTVAIIQEPDCSTPAIIEATPKKAYKFTQWSDGNTDNPRTLPLTKDTVLTAEFAVATEGQCGEHLYWAFDTVTTTLTITGEGDMYDERPWILFVNNITNVLFPYGITHIGNDAFSNCVNLRSIIIPATVTSIGNYAFAGCRNLRDITCYPLLPPYAETTSFANYNVNLNVPCDYLEEYQYDIVFGSFKIKCLGAESDTVDPDDVIIAPGATDVTIIWPTRENAYTYTIIINKNGQVVCTLTFDHIGRLLNIAFAPSREGVRPVPHAEQTTSNGFRFTVTGLEENTNYAYDITTSDEEDNTLSSTSGTFTTQRNTPTDIENTNSQSPEAKVQKFLRDGQLIILRDGVEYNAIGVEL